MAKRSIRIGVQMDLGNWSRILWGRLRRQFPALAVATVVAVLALASGVTPLFVAASWFLILLSCLWAQVRRRRPNRC